MSITTILIVITVFSALSIIVLALMQTSKGDMGSAFGGGGSQSMFGARGSANFLSRSTAVMVTVFFTSSIALAYFYAQRDEAQSVVDSSVIGSESVSEVPELSVDDAVLEADSTELPALENEESLEVPTLDEASEETSEELPVVEGNQG